MFVICQDQCPIDPIELSGRATWAGTYGGPIRRKGRWVGGPVVPIVLRSNRSKASTGAGGDVPRLQELSRNAFSPQPLHLTADA